MQANFKGLSACTPPNYNNNNNNIIPSLGPSARAGLPAGSLQHPNNNNDINIEENHNNNNNNNNNSEIQHYYYYCYLQNAREQQQQRQQQQLMNTNNNNNNEDPNTNVYNLPYNNFTFSHMNDRNNNNNDFMDNNSNFQRKLSFQEFLRYHDGHNYPMNQNVNNNNNNYYPGNRMTGGFAPSFSLPTPQEYYNFYNTNNNNNMTSRYPLPYAGSNASPFNYLSQPQQQQQHQYHNNNNMMMMNTNYIKNACVTPISLQPGERGEEEAAAHATAATPAQPQQQQPPSAVHTLHNNNNTTVNVADTTTSSILSISSAEPLSPFNINIYAEEHCLLCGERGHPYNCCEGSDGTLLCFYSQSEECVYVMRHPSWEAEATLEDIILFVEQCMKFDRSEVELWLDGKPFGKLGLHYYNNWLRRQQRNFNNHNNNNTIHNNMLAIKENVNSLSHERFAAIPCQAVRLLPGAVIYVAPKGMFYKSAVSPNSAKEGNAEGNVNNNNNNKNVEEGVEKEEGKASGDSQPPQLEKNETDGKNNSTKKAAGQEEAPKVVTTKDTDKHANNNNNNNNVAPSDSKSSKDHTENTAATENNNTTDNKSKDATPAEKEKKADSWGTLAQLLRLRLAAGGSTTIVPREEKAQVIRATPSDPSNTNKAGKTSEGSKNVNELMAAASNGSQPNSNNTDTKGKTEAAKPAAAPNSSKDKTEQNEEKHAHEPKNDDENEEVETNDPQENDGEMADDEELSYDNVILNERSRKAAKRLELKQIAENESKGIEESEEEKRLRTLHIKFIPSSVSFYNLRLLLFSYGEVDKVRLVKPKNLYEGERNYRDNNNNNNRKRNAKRIFFVSFVEYHTQVEANYARYMLQGYDMGNRHLLDVHIAKQHISGGFMTDKDKDTGKPCTFGLYRDKIEEINNYYGFSNPHTRSSSSNNNPYHHRPSKNANTNDEQEEDGKEERLLVKATHPLSKRNGSRHSNNNNNNNDNDNNDRYASKKAGRGSGAHTPSAPASRTPRNENTKADTTYNKNKNDEKKKDKEDGEREKEEEVNPITPPKQRRNNKTNVKYSSKRDKLDTNTNTSSPCSPHSVGLTPSTKGSKSSTRSSNNDNNYLNKGTEDQELQLIPVPEELDPTSHEDTNINNTKEGGEEEEEVSETTDSSHTAAFVSPSKGEAEEGEEKDNRNNNRMNRELMDCSAEDPYLPRWDATQIAQLQRMRALLRDSVQIYMNTREESTFFTALHLITELLYFPAGTCLASNNTSLNTNPNKGELSNLNQEDPKDDDNNHNNDHYNVRVQPNAVLLRLELIVTQVSLFIEMNGSGDGRQAAEAAQEVILLCQSYVRTMRDLLRTLPSNNSNNNNNNTNSINSTFLRDASWWPLFTSLDVKQQTEVKRIWMNTHTPNNSTDEKDKEVIKKGSEAVAPANYQECVGEALRTSSLLYFNPMTQGTSTPTETNNNNNKECQGELQTVLAFVSRRPFPRVDAVYCFVQRLLQLCLLLDSFLQQREGRVKPNNNNNKGNPQLPPRYPTSNNNNNMKMLDEEEVEELQYVRRTVVQLVESLRLIVTQMVKLYSLLPSSSSTTTITVTVTATTNKDTTNNNNEASTAAAEDNKDDDLLPNKMKSLLTLLPDATAILRGESAAAFHKLFSLHHHNNTKEEEQKLEHYSGYLLAGQLDAPVY